MVDGNICQLSITAVALPGPASTVEELRTTEREDPGSTPDEGS
jgi:hypothetical protein